MAQTQWADIESTFATVRHRTTETKGCLSRQTALAMTHQLMLSAKKKRRKLDGQKKRLPKIIEGVEFRDGINAKATASIAGAGSGSGPI